MSDSYKDEWRRDWILSRMNLMKEVKAHVSYRVGELDSELSKAEALYKDYFGGGWSPSSRDLMIQKTNQAQVVLGADFHAYPQSQKSHLRIIRELLTRRPIIIALESFGFEDQEYIDQYIKRKISEEEFLEKSQWSQQWGFPWSTYRMIFNYARDKGIAIKGINTHSILPDEAESFNYREEAVVLAIEKWLAREPEALIYVLFGELHLSPNYLPKRLIDRLNITPLTIHQNSEELYFSLAEKNQENSVNVLCKDEINFCVMESPPWVKWQSYLMFLEETYDVDLDEEEEFLVVDHTDTVARHIEFIAKDLGEPLAWDEVNDLAVYEAEKDDLWEAFEEYKSGLYKEAVSYFVKIEKSFFHPESGIAFLSRLTVNHAAEVAGHYLQARLSNRKKPLWDVPECFLANIYLEMLGFFASKLINNKRKAESLEEIRIRLSQMRQGNEAREALLLVLDYRLTEVIHLNEGRQRKKVFKPKNKGDYFVAARIIGQMLGEKLYSCFSSKKMEPSEVLELYKKNLELDSFEESYYAFLKRLYKMHGEIL